MGTEQRTSTIADIRLADEGEQRIRWVEQHSPVLRALRPTLGDGALEGRTIALAIHLEAKTAFLALVLSEAGASVTVGGSNPYTTRDDVCAALVRRGLTVHAIHGASRQAWEQHLERVLDCEPDLIVDDGAELVSRLVARKPHLVGRVRGSSEETTTGVLKLRAMVGDGVLTWPAIAANDAACKHMFDNRYGTGQTAVEAIYRVTNLWAGDKVVVVAGYGWVGRGVARFAAGTGSRVVVSEIDPVKALEAVADGHTVMCMAEAAPRGDIFITTTGGINTIGGEHMAAMKDGAILANAGHYDHEIALDDLRAMSSGEEQVRAHVTQYRLENGRHLNVIAGGELVNIVAGDGHPVEIMDLSFAVQAMSAHYLAGHAGDLAPGVHPPPPSIDRRIAQTKLDTLGIRLDQLTPEQTRYLSTWR